MLVKTLSHAWLMILLLLETVLKTAGLIGSKVLPSKLERILPQETQLDKTCTSGFLTRVSSAVLTLTDLLSLVLPIARSTLIQSAVSQRSPDLVPIPEHQSASQPSHGKSETESLR